MNPKNLNPQDKAIQITNEFIADHNKENPKDMIQLNKRKIRKIAILGAEVWSRILCPKSNLSAQLPVFFRETMPEHSLADLL